MAGEDRPSAALRALWAKSPGDGQQPLALLTHLADACETADIYWHGFVSERLRGQLVETLGGDERLARVLVRWLAAAHDTGKATPSFAGQVPALRERVERGGLPLIDDPRVNAELRHDLAGAVLWRERLLARGWSPVVVDSFALVIAGHHGSYPDNVKLNEAIADGYCTGRRHDAWRAVQAEVMDAVERIAGIDEADFDRLSQRPLDVPMQLQLAGVVIHADWIASDALRFPLARPDSSGLPDPRDARSRAVDAWHDLELPGPWALRSGADGIGEHYRARFAWPEHRAPRPVQQGALELARAAEPGLMVIEAPMGAGKTEAALCVAEEWGARSGASGLYMALPTMATSDAMLVRVLEWVDHLPVDAPLSVFLAHSKRAFNRRFAALPHTIHARTDGDVGEGSEHAVIAEWLTGRRRGIAANVVVGTVDHVLMLALRSRFAALRFGALAGKVVVIDEVHASDTRMLSFLERTLEWLAASSVPVVLLSATLPESLRRRLVGAYELGLRHRLRGLAAGAAPSAGPAAPVAGRRKRTRTRGREGGAVSASSEPSDPGREAGERDTAVDDAHRPAEPEYPLLTVVDSAGHLVQRAPGTAGVASTSVRLEPIDDELEVLVDELRERTRDGGCVLIVRNTVSRAVRLFDALAADPVLGRDLTLAHSRFIAPHRAANDARLVARFGPPTPGLERPGQDGPSIVVATQVAEMSLDVDFDLLVSDLAPVDAMLQRIGRLHRHRRDSRPAALTRPTCLVAGVTDWTTTPPAFDRGSATVYGAAALMRSLVALQPHLGADARDVRLPDDIAPLVDGADRARIDLVGGWGEAAREAERRAAAARARSEEAAERWRIPHLADLPDLVGFTSAAVDDRDESLGLATVRDGEDTFEVLLLQAGTDASTLRTLDVDGRDGVLVPVEMVPGTREAMAAAACSIRLPASVCIGARGDRVIDDLECTLRPAWQQSPFLRGQLVVELDADGRAVVGGFTLHYDSARGLEVTRSDSA